MKKITGSLVKLTQLTSNDYEYFYTWFKDKEVIKYSLSKWQKRHSKVEIKKWLDNTLQDKTVVTFGIIENATKKLIGYAGINGISKLSNSGEYFIFIGETHAWSKGYGTEVTKLVVDYGFKKLGLHRIFLTVSEPNVGGIKAYIKAGFKKEGVLRDAAFRDGTYHHKIMMSILQSEWNS